LLLPSSLLSSPTPPQSRAPFTALTPAAQWARVTVRGGLATVILGGACKRCCDGLIFLVMQQKGACEGRTSKRNKPRQREGQGAGAAHWAEREKYTRGPAKERRKEKSKLFFFLLHRHRPRGVAPAPPSLYFRVLLSSSRRPRTPPPPPTFPLSLNPPTKSTMREVISVHIGQAGAS